MDAVIVNPAETKPIIKTGDSKIFAVMSAKGLPAFSDVPTVLKSGLDFLFSVWRGIFIAAGGLEKTIEKLCGYVDQVTENEFFIEFMETNGTNIRYRDQKNLLNLLEKKINFNQDY